MADSPKVTGFELTGDPSAEALRVCVIGARRVRNGTGPFLARQVADAGAELVGVLGTTPALFGQAAAAYVLCQLARQPFSPEPVFWCAPALPACPALPCLPACLPACPAWPAMSSASVL